MSDVVVQCLVASAGAIFAFTVAMFMIFGEDK